MRVRTWTLDSIKLSPIASRPKRRIADSAHSTQSSHPNEREGRVAGRYRPMARDSCLARVGAGVAVGGAIGGAVGTSFRS